MARAAMLREIKSRMSGKAVGSEVGGLDLKLSFLDCLGDKDVFGAKVSVGKVGNRSWIKLRGRRGEKRGSRPSRNKVKRPKGVAEGK